MNRNGPRLDWRHNEEQRIQDDTRAGIEREERHRYNEQPGDPHAPKFYRAPTPAEIATGEIAPFVMLEKVPCDTCAERSFEENPEPGPCPTCRGRKFTRVKRRWLAEAFAIVADTQTSQRVERGHLVALATYGRIVMSALTPRFPE